jgi:predicted nuclease with RNAse H fold
MSPTRRVWAGVDVGGRRKGFHVTVIDAARVVRPPERLREPADVVAWLLREGPRPALVGVDSPCALALDDGRRRADERRVARAVCGIRYTPSPAELARQRGKPGQAGRYYEWIEQGLALYDGLARAGLTAIECFPTASWTCWFGPRRATRRTEWSARALARLGLRAVPAALDQDGRDAIGAAATAREHDRGRTEAFGDIVVPKRRAGRAG